MLTTEKVKKIIVDNKCLYETEGGFRFQGLPVSEIPSALRFAGWRNVSHIDGHDLKKLGLKIVTARYVGGVSKKKFCNVAIGALRWDFRTGQGVVA